MDTNLENKEVVKEPEVKEPEVKQESPTEVAARESGWVTKDEWVAQGKDPDAWRSAREFQERGELFEEIQRLKDSDKKTKAAFKVLVEHHKKVRELAVTEALEKLKAQKREALENHEIDKVFDIDEQIERVRNDPVSVPDIDIPAEEAGPTPTFKSWHKKNNWYQLTGDDEISRWADVIGLQYRKSHPDATETEFLEHVESKVAKRFPEVFENPNSKRSREVNPTGNEKGGGHDNFKLTEAEETVCKMLVANGDMTRKEYIDQIKKVRGG